jgi:hypothetical protein
MIAAAKMTETILLYAPSSLWSDLKFAKGIVQVYGNQLENVKGAARTDRDVVLAAVQCDGHALKFAGEFRSDRELVLDALSSKGTALMYVDPAFKKDHAIVLHAVRSDKMAVVHADPELRQDEEIKQAVDMARTDGEALADAGRMRRVRKQFEEADANGDGYIDPMELGFILKKLNPTAWSDSKIRQLFRAADQDNDDKIAYNEFIDWLNTPYAPM